MDKLSVDDMEIGKTYRLVGEDCCISIDLTAELTGITVVGEGEDSTVTDLLFGKTRLFDSFWAYNITEVNDVD